MEDEFEQRGKRPSDESLIAIQEWFFSPGHLEALSALREAVEVLGRVLEVEALLMFLDIRNKGDVSREDLNEFWSFYVAYQQTLDFILSIRSMYDEKKSSCSTH